ncbi:MAG: hypothetical protein WCK98_06690 [bacterium]
MQNLPPPTLPSLESHLNNSNTPGIVQLVTNFSQQKEPTAAQANPQSETDSVVSKSPEPITQRQYEQNPAVWTFAFQTTSNGQTFNYTASYPTKQLCQSAQASTALPGIIKINGQKVLVDLPILQITTPCTESKIQQVNSSEIMFAVNPTNNPGNQSDSQVTFTSPSPSKTI